MNDTNYSNLRNGLVELQAEFERATEMGMRCRHELLHYDPTMLNLGIVKVTTPHVAWSGFIERHQRAFPDGPNTWEVWEPFPDGSACSRFHGVGNSESLREFRELASRGFVLLKALRDFIETDNDAPGETTVELPKVENRSDCEHVGWIVSVYETGRKFPTSVLRAEYKNLWGGIDSTPSDPTYESLSNDLFRSSAEAIRLWCDPSSPVPVSEWEQTPSLFFPPTDTDSANLKPVWDAERRELSFDGKLIKVFKSKSTNQEFVIKAFHELGWLPRIDDPIPPTGGIPPKKRLSDTIDALNDAHKTPHLIRFRRDGTGEGVVWDIVKDLQ